MTTPGGSAASAEDFIVDTCSYAIDPIAASIGSAADVGSVTVTAPGGCAWKVLSNDGWLNVTGGASGTGDGTVSWSADANPGAPRAGSLTIAGQNFPVTQGSTCSYTVDPLALTAPAGGESGTITVTTSEGCAWSAVSPSPWISVTSGNSGSGSGTVDYVVASSSGPVRSTNLSVAGQSVTVGQESGCALSVTPGPLLLPSAATSAEITVNIGAGCTWSAASGAPWLTVAEGATGSGNGTVVVSATANTGAVRATDVTVNGRVVTLSQADPYLVELSGPFTDAYDGAVTWGDYDGDGDLDLVLVGYTGSERLAKLYRNDGASGFTGVDAGLLPVANGSVEWGDYDADGDLDLLLTGAPYSNTTYVSLVYRNDGGGVFSDIGAGLDGIRDGYATWGDYDNDGDLDIALAGRHGSGHDYIARIYRNDGLDTFGDVGAALEGVVYAAVGWGDYDNDGDLDLLLGGANDQRRFLRVYRNDGSSGFVDAGVALPPVSPATAAWGDYDNDGDVDLVLGGFNGTARMLAVYRNDAGGTFVDAGVALPDSPYQSALWGDLDNDGDLDLLVTGGVVEEPPWFRTAVYRNGGAGSFTAVGVDLPALSGRTAAGDYDADGDLDIALMGKDLAGGLTKVYRNDSPNANTAPQPPSALAAADGAGTVTLSWSASSDMLTPAAGLTYNVRVGTTAGSDDVVPAMALPATGTRTVARMGNAGHRTSFMLKGLPPGNYHWSVQAIDTSFVASPFAAEGTVVSCAATIDPTSSSYPREGGTGSVTVATDAGCAWLAETPRRGSR